MENNYVNKRKGKVLFKCFVSPEELEILLTSENGEQVIKTLGEIRTRQDIV